MFNWYNAYNAYNIFFIINIVYRKLGLQVTGYQLLQRAALPPHAVLISPNCKAFALAIDPAEAAAEAPAAANGVPADNGRLLQNK